MVPARPTPTFEVIETEFLFHLLVVLFHPPAFAGGRYQLAQARVLRQITEIVLRGLGFARRPLHQQPDFGARRLAMIPVMCTLDLPSPEARVQFAFAALAPGHRPESLFVGLRQFFHGHRFLATKAQAPRWSALSFPFRNGA